MAEIKWIKLSTDLFNNRKIKQIERRKDRDVIEIVWIKLLILAATINDGGRIYLTSAIPFDMETLACELDRTPNAVEKALGMFEQYGMVKRENGFITIVNWNKYQDFEKLDELKKQARERKRKQREKEAASQNMSQDMSRDGHVTSRCREEEIREDNKKDENRKRERIEDSVSPLSLPDTQNEFLFDDGDAGGGCVEEFDTKIKPLHGTLGRGVVMLSEKQIDLLLQELSIEEFDKYVDVVASQIEKGKTYGKTHYQAILDMAYQDRGM